MMFNTGAGSRVDRQCTLECNEKKFVTLFLACTVRTDIKLRPSS